MESAGIDQAHRLLPGLKKISTIIADDEPLARERIRTLLADEPDVEIVAECADGAQAFQETQQRRPDLLFLDVQMPRLDGFEVLEALSPGPLPVVVFTTAHDEHAIRAFEFNALDYLLKPFTEARFKMALQKARAQPPQSGSPAPGPSTRRMENFAITRCPGLHACIAFPAQCGVTQ